MIKKRKKLEVYITMDKKKNTTENHELNTPTLTQEYRIFGIRHHGPGSANSLLAALQTWHPDLLLVEGPYEVAPGAETLKINTQKLTKTAASEIQTLLSFVNHPDMQPPVALLVYNPDQPQQASFYPFAEYSPEWQALRYGTGQNIPIRFIDLPFAVRLGLQTIHNQNSSQQQPPLPENQQNPVPPLTVETENPKQLENENIDQLQFASKLDPLDQIARIAGFSDGERWWEYMVEQRQDSQQLFQAIIELMTAVRTAEPEELQLPAPPLTPAAVAGPHLDKNIESLREVWMRCAIRQALKEGFRRIAVICGAWHSPALTALEKNQVTDNQWIALLSELNLPRVNIHATWVQYSNQRLVITGGYGAGITSPGWYEHLWKLRTKTPEEAAPHWMTKVAHCFREARIDASPAHVIEAVRTAIALATVRGFAAPGLDELMEATKAVFCMGSDIPLKIIERKLLIQDRIGQIPQTVPMLPLKQDLVKCRKALGLEEKDLNRMREKQGIDSAKIVLDLREDKDTRRSRFLYRLRLLNIPFGIITNKHQKGTNKEAWQLRWDPAFEIALIEAQQWGGNTIQIAAANLLNHKATHSEELEELSGLVTDMLYADLPQAAEAVLKKLQQVSARSTDIIKQLTVVTPLAEQLRYGTARKTDLEVLAQIIDGMIIRICLGLPNACHSIDEKVANEILEKINDFERTVIIISENPEHQQLWNQALEQIATSNATRILQGQAVRLLFEHKYWNENRLHQAFSLNLSIATPPSEAAAWLDGFLGNSLSIIIGQPVIRKLLFEWVSLQTEENFRRVLPLLRRTFARFPRGEHNQMTRVVFEMTDPETAARRKAQEQATAAELIDPIRAAKVIPILKTLLGIN